MSIPSSALSHAIAQHLGDKSRISPTLAGAALVDGSRLVVRLPQGEVNVQAPAALLKRVFRWCDGNRSWQDIVSRQSATQRDTLDQFMAFLMAQGALVDANLLTATAAGWGQQTMAIGLAAPSDFTAQIAQRFRSDNSEAGTPVAPSPMLPLWAQRVSTYTFDETPLTVEQLHGLLWPLAGIVHDAHPRTGKFAAHRTLASGGALYLIDWYVALVQAVGAYAPGVYRIHYPRPQCIQLELVQQDTSQFHRAFLHPWQQSYAAGAVFGIAQTEVSALRYRNRALQYHYLEAGAALQNLSLIAPTLGIANAIIGGYCEEHVKQLCGLVPEQTPYQLVLTSSIFGAAPTTEQRAWQSRMMPIDFVWSSAGGGPYELPFHLARARPQGKQEEQFNTWGKDRAPWLAYVKAHVEAIERQGLREARNVQVASVKDVPNAIHPQTLIRYAPAQYRRSDFPHRPFDAQQTYHWVPAIDIRTGHTHHVLGEFVYGEALNPWPITGNSYTSMNSSGCAAGRTLEDAITAGLLEVIERDAFMRHWLAQQPGLRIQLQHLPAPLQQRIRVMQDAGCTVVLQKLRSAAGHVVLSSATHDGLHFTCVSAGARWDLADAAQSALDELDTMVYTRLLGEDFTPCKPQDVRSAADHALLYAQKAYYGRADAVLQPTSDYVPEPTQVEVGSTVTSTLTSVTQALHQQGLQTLYVDITPKQAFIDQGRTPISVVKAIVPTLIPLSFGYAREPRGMVASVHRDAFFPHPFP